MTQVHRYHHFVGTSERIGFRHKSYRAYLNDFKAQCAARGRMDLWQRLSVVHDGRCRCSKATIIKLTGMLRQGYVASVEAYLRKMEEDAPPPDPAAAGFWRAERAAGELRTIVAGGGSSRRQKASKLLDQVADAGLGDLLQDDEP